MLPPCCEGAAAVNKPFSSVNPLKCGTSQSSLFHSFMLHQRWRLPSESCTSPLTYLGLVLVGREALKRAAPRRSKVCLPLGSKTNMKGFCGRGRNERGTQR